MSRQARLCCCGIPLSLHYPSGAYDHGYSKGKEDERRRLREEVKALTVHTTIKGSGMDAEVVDCYTVDDIAAIFGDTP